MSSYKTDQRRLVHRGSEFHFVSYEGHLANPGRGVAAEPATWFLMRAGKRWPVMAQIPEQNPTEVDDQLLRWLDDHIFAGRTGTSRASRASAG